MRMLKVFKVFVCVAAAVAVFGYVTMRLWNWLMPELFGVHAIRFTQAVGLLVLSKILFGGFHKHGRRGRWERGFNQKQVHAWKRRMKERFEHMTPEEKERFQSAMKERWSGGCGPRTWGRGRGFGREGFGPPRKGFNAKEDVNG